MNSQSSSDGLPFSSKLESWLSSGSPWTCPFCSASASFSPSLASENPRTKPTALSHDLPSSATCGLRLSQSFSSATTTTKIFTTTVVASFRPVEVSAAFSDFHNAPFCSHLFFISVIIHTSGFIPDSSRSLNSRECKCLRCPSLLAKKHCPETGA